MKKKKTWCILSILFQWQMPIFDADIKYKMGEMSFKEQLNHINISIDQCICF